LLGQHNISRDCRPSVPMTSGSTAVCADALEDDGGAGEDCCDTCGAPGGRIRCSSCACVFHLDCAGTFFPGFFCPTPVASLHLITLYQGSLVPCLHVHSILMQ